MLTNPVALLQRIHRIKPHGGVVNQRARIVDRDIRLPTHRVQIERNVTTALNKPINERPPNVVQHSNPNVRSRGGGERGIVLADRKERGIWIE